MADNELPPNSDGHSGENGELSDDSEDDAPYSHWLDLKQAASESQKVSDPVRVRPATTRNHANRGAARAERIEASGSATKAAPAANVAEDSDEDDIGKSVTLDEIATSVEDLAYAVGRLEIDAVTLDDIQTLSKSVDGLTHAFVGMRSKLELLPKRTEIWWIAGILGVLVILSLVLTPESVFGIFQMLSPQISPAAP